MNAQKKNEKLAQRMLHAFGFWDVDAAEILRRAELVLHRWAELECGDGNNHASWCIERDDSTDIPYMCTYWHSGRTTRNRIADREAGALRRVAALCKRLGLYFYQQTDPRGAALYVSKEPLTHSNYSSVGVCCSVG